MRAFWDDCGRGPDSTAARPVDLGEAQRIWSDLSGVQGNYLGLIDDEERTIQFCFLSGIPDDVDDARHLRIVLVDIPLPERGGSYAGEIAIGDVHRLIEQAFAVGADHSRFGGLTFSAWNSDPAAG